MSALQHVRNILIKYLFTAIVTTAVLTGFYGHPVTTSFRIALIITLALYVSGDLTVLPVMGNFIATVADSGSALVLAYVAPYYSTLDAAPFGAAVAIAVLLAACEYFFHGYLQHDTLPGPLTGEGR